jgi:NitT/TauT family transport system ATP-binding protein
MDIEDFFPLVELSTLLQFAQVVEGDIELTAEGIQFARATVLERKKLFSEQLLAHVPFVQQMITILQSKSNKKMNIEFFEDLLARTFGDKKAQSQMALLISWERYAELVEYDQDKEQVYLESTI